MFNKSMSIVRKLLNELIVNGEIDQETEVVVELARELNDNNERAAIERYQKVWWVFIPNKLIPEEHWYGFLYDFIWD